MRRFFVLTVLLLVMLGLHALQVDPIGVGDPLTLAAIGFVVLAAFTIAEVGGSLGLPAVTGYIVAGVLLGPYAGNILSEAVVTDMGMFNTLALGLIATTAGLELDARQIQKLWRTLAATIGLKIVLCFVLVGGAFLLVQSLLSPLTVTLTGGTLALALVFGALAIGTSPAIVLAVITESRAKGRLSELVLGAAVAKDVVVVVSLAIALAIARSLIAPDASFDVEVLIHTATELGASVLAGAVLGGLLIAYVRYVHVEMLIFVAAMILVVAELASALHLETLLVFIVAGFVVRNLSNYEHHLMKPLEMVALPVFVVFFTIAGASIDLQATWQILPLALVLAVTRGVAFALASRFGGQFGGESAAIQNQAVWAYLPQAGVTLVLVGFAAERLPELAGSIESVGIGVVALHLLVGPITLRRSLQQVGDIKVSQPKAAVREMPAARARVAAGADDDDPTPSRPDRAGRAERIQATCRGIEDPELVALLRDLHDDLMAVALRIADEQWAPWARATTRSACAALDGGEDGAKLRTWAAQPHGDSVARFGETARQTFDEMRARLRNLPLEVDAPFRTEDLQPGPHDNWLLRGRKFAVRNQQRWLPRHRSAYRRVPVRLAARMALEPEL
ncbi:MAG: cation:proton antiporter, partial [Myxococcales bacterium]|nr:cation:proton antiporter [Myxococcales bacterium]